MNNHSLLVRILAGKLGFPWGNQTDSTPNPCLWGVCNLLEEILWYLRWLACKIERGVPYSEIEFSWGFGGGKARMPIMWKRRMRNICEGRSIQGRIWILGGTGQIRVRKYILSVEVNLPGGGGRQHTVRERDLICFHQNGVFFVQNWWEIDLQRKIKTNGEGWCISDQRV